MEVAGVVIGALALIGVFEDCITLFSQIGAAKSMEKDYVLLATRLDLQKALLLQWAERMKIYDKRLYDPRLNNPSVASLIYRTLDCTRKLLQDGTALQERYGVRLADVEEEVEPSTAASGGLMSRLRNNPLALRLRRDVPVIPLDQSESLDLSSGSNHRAKRPRSEVELPLPLQEALIHRRPEDSLDNKRARHRSQISQSHHFYQLPDDNRKGKTSNLDKIIWVIKDKEQFDSLVRKLSEMISDIDRLVPPQRGDDPKHTILEHDIQALKSVRELREIMYASATDNTELISITKRAINEASTQLILSRLWFRLIDDREHNIADAHSKTLEWSIQPPASGVVWDDLGRWLRSGRDIYWIHGKPGSGKSTLMKFLYHHPKVMSWLHKWAGSRKLTVASFFLWNIGAVEQSSQEGLARGLLYHVLKQNPALTPAVLPYMWQEAQNGIVDPRLPSNSEMKTAFQQIGAETTTGAFAFFIDGLDEFTGNHRDGISFVKSLITSANIKMLVSSRPIDTCVAAFSSAPRLRLQDLTEPDIERYINDVLRSHPYVCEHQCLSDATVKGLLEDMQSKASGVFLWVVLACRTLIEGFEAFDNAEELQRRVEELPPELESLFRHILNNLPPRSLQQAAKLLRVCHTYRKLQKNYYMPAFLLAWAHENDMKLSALKQFEPWSLRKRAEKCVMLEGRLRSRCRGLLEVHTHSSQSTRDGPSVDFMHRTVFEYLSTPDVWELDCLQIHDPDFDAITVLAYMYSYKLYLLWTPTSKNGDLVTEAIRNLEAEELSSPSNLPRILNYLASALMRPKEGRLPFFGSFQHDLSLDSATVLLAVELNLTTFVQSYDLQSYKNRQTERDHGAPRRHNLLYHALQKPLLYKNAEDIFCILHSATMVHHLIRTGCDPDESIVYREMFTTTPWNTWLGEIEPQTRKDHHYSNYREQHVPRAEITMLLIRAGVNISNHEETLMTVSKQWSELSDKFEDVCLGEQLRGLCKEIEQAVATSREHKYDRQGAYC